MHKLLGLPVVASEHGRDVDNLIIYVHWLMIALFVGWIAYFAYALFRFHRRRNPRGDYVGVKNHSSNYIELAVVAVEGFLLIAIAVPLWSKAVDQLPSAEESTVIHVAGQQFAWNVRYPGKDGEFGRQDMHRVSGDNPFGVDLSDPAAQDDVQWLNEIRVPMGKPIIAYITSKDVIHSFKINALRVTQDAIPGMRVPVWFKPTMEGRYQIKCAQLCGNGHFSMSQGYLIVESQESFDEWLASRAGGATTFE
jgi:cytochrome c oxidase subunit II